MFISEAWASAGAADPSSGDFIMSLVPILLIFAVFYILLLRPQQKRIKEHKAILNELVKGDKIVTGGGIIAEVKKVVNDYELVVELAKGTEVRIARSTVQGKWDMPDSLEPINKKTAAKAEDKKAEDKPKKKAPAKKKASTAKKTTAKKKTSTAKKTATKKAKS